MQKGGIRDKREERGEKGEEREKIFTLSGRFLLRRNSKGGRKLIAQLAEESVVEG